MVSYVRDEPVVDLPEWFIEDSARDISTGDDRREDDSMLGRYRAIPVTEHVSTNINYQIRQYVTDQGYMPVEKLSWLLQEALTRCRSSTT